MDATTARQDNLFSLDPALRLPFVISIAFHLAVLVAFSISLPYIRPPAELRQPISVELIDIGDVTQTIKAAPPKKVVEDKPEQAPPEEKLKPPEMKEEPKPVEEPTPPEPEKIEQEEPKPEPKPEEKPKEKPKPPEPVKEKPKEEPKQEEDFESLLKNLAPATPESETVAEEAPEETTPEQTLDTSNLSDRMTISEEDAFAARFRDQFKPCWNIPIGAKDAETLAVEIRVIVNQDKTIQRSIILDQGRYNREPSYRAMADSAQRALQNPMCARPLPLPDGRYNAWKTIVVNFDPREML